MKKLILFFLLIATSLAQSPVNVQKGGFAGTNNITGNLNFPTGTTLTIGSGGSLTFLSGATLTATPGCASSFLDALGSTRGSLLYRGVSGWTILVPGTSGQVLNSAGAGADPFWGAGGGGGGSGTVTSVTVTPANGVTATVANQGTTPALTFTLGAITPSTVDGITFSGFSSPTLAVTGTSSVSGANTGDQTTITGNAGSATVLQTGRTINGVSFNGSANITVPAAANTLTGTNLASGVTTSSLTTAQGGTFGTAAFTDAAAYQPSDAGLTALATGSDSVVFLGPNTSNKSFTLPNASATILTTNSAVTVAQGGLGITSGNSGGIPYFSGTTTIASSTLLTANALMVGGGSGAAPSSLGSLGTTTTLLHGNAAGVPTFGAVTLTTDVTGILGVANGGSGESTTTPYSIVFTGTSGTGVWKVDLGPGTSGQVITSNGPGFYPSWQAGGGGGGVSVTGTPTSGQLAQWTNATTVQGLAVTGTGSAVLAVSPALTGVPIAPTATVGTNTTQLATTAFVLANLPTTLIPTSVKTTNYTAVVGDFIPVDTTSGNVTITLPTAPADGSQIGIKMVIRGGTNTATYATGGSDVINRSGGPTTGTLNILSASALMQYKASGAIWYIVTGDTPYGSLLAAANTWTGIQTFTTPILGTPTSGLMTNVTGLPLTTGVTGTLPIANGGTNLTTLTANNVILGNGTSSPLFVAPGTSGNVLTSNGTTWTSAASTGGGGGNNSALFSNTATATVANTVTETSVIGTGIGSKTTTAGYFAAGTELKMELSGFFSSAVVDTLNVKIKAGSTVVGSTGAIAYGSITNKVVRLYANIKCLSSGTSGTFIVNTILETAGSALAPQEAQILNTSTVTLNTTLTQAWDVTATWSAASASDTVTGGDFIMFTPGTGMTDSGVNGVQTRTGLNTLAAADASAMAAPSYAADTSGSDAYVITLSPAPTSYATGAHYTTVVANSNVGAATLNVNALGAKAIKKYVSGSKADLGDNDIVAGQIIEFVYDGTDMVIPRLNSYPDLYSDLGSTDTTTTANTAQDTLISFSLLANSKYDVDIFVPISGPAAGTEVGVVSPTGSTYRLGVYGRQSTSTTFIASVITTDGLNGSAFAVGSTAGFAHIIGKLTTSSTAGTFKITFASVTSGQTSTIISAGAIGHVHKL